ncbi:hypothetical protein BDR03DRAFT_969492 [Suillus americanus]|nr:hypothetical protein BDR03DRAFT_969492 [Suillus americanus]
MTCPLPSIRPTSYDALTSIDNAGNASNDRVTVSAHVIDSSDDKTPMVDFQRLLESRLMDT